MGRHTKKLSECERCFLGGVRSYSERSTKDEQRALFGDRERCGQYILLKISYVTRSV